MMIYLMLLLFIISKFQLVLTLNDIKNCRTALGMQSGRIVDSQLTASSSFNELTLGPMSSRIRTEKYDGAWCPKEQTNYEYLQVNLKTLHVLRVIETQGRYGNGNGQEYTEKYRVEYTRDKKISNNTRWIQYKDRDNTTWFDGNRDTFTAQLNELNRPIIARFVRIIPDLRVKKTACLRVELYGCQFKDDIVSYETRNGDARGATFNFKDKIYDGVEMTNGYLRNGLGLLTDGELGDDSITNDHYGTKGYHWLGWHNKTSKQQAVYEPHRILFKFDNIRNFSLCTLYVNNMPEYRIELYSMVRFKFSLNGVDFVGEDVESTVNRDRMMSMARPLLVPLQFNVAKYVLVELYFYSKWFIVSEITFDSEYVDDVAFTQFDNPLARLEKEALAQLYDQMNETQFIVSSSTSSKSEVNGSNSSFMNNTITAQALIMILITLLVLLVVIFVFIVCCFIKKRERLNKKFQHQFHHHQAKKSPFCWHKISEFFCKNKSRSATNTLTTALTSTTSSTTSSGIVPQNHLITSLQSANLNTLSTAMSSQHPHLNNLDTIKSTKFLTNFEQGLENAYLYPSLKYKTGNENAEVLKAILQQQRYLKIAENQNNIHYAATDLSPSSTTTTTSTNSALNNNNKMIKLVTMQQHQQQYSSNNHSNNINQSQNLYYTIKPQSTFASQTISRIQMQQLQQQQQQQQQFVSMRKIDANLLSFLDKVGESTVSNFYVGKMNTKSLTSSLLINENEPNAETDDDAHTDVLIKVLKTENDPVIKFGFDNDIDLTILNKLKIDNLNLIKLMGFCDNPYCYIIDYYSPNSNLYEQMCTNSESPIFNSKKCYIDICLQITNAMLYLESINSIHKDLTCKNCIISIDNNNDTTNISIKICDLARYMYNYRQDYCILLTNTQQSIRLRHTAWETICTGQFTSKSDVWSFGVILFELLTLGKQVAFSDLNDEQLIQFINTTYIQQQQQQTTDVNYLIHSYLAKQCVIDELKANANSAELVDLMFECFNLNIFSRPTFNDLNLYLKYQYETNS